MTPPPPHTHRVVSCRFSGGGSPLAPLNLNQTPVAYILQLVVGQSNKPRHRALMSVCTLNVHLVSATVTGRSKVIYTNYQYALVYECHQEAAAGTCMHGQDSLDLYSRTRDVPEALRTQLFKRAVDFCLDARDLVTVTHNRMWTCFSSSLHWCCNYIY